MLARTIGCCSVFAALMFADTLQLRSGRAVEGTYLGGNARQIRMEVANRIETFDINEVTSVSFGSAGGTSNSSRASAQPSQPARAAAQDQGVAINSPHRPLTPVTPAASTEMSGKSSGVEVPAGTAIVIRMIDDVDSGRDSVGQTFRASIDEPVILDNRTVIPRGADVVVKLVQDRDAGRLSGRTELTMDLQSITVDGKSIEILTQEVTQQGESRTGRTAKVVGGTAALGAIIGAIAGGGKGAAIGAVSGAAAGGAVQVLTKGEQVKIPSETRLSFALQQAVRL